MDWSKSIKELREKMQLSQQEFAKVLGISFASVNRYENGRHEPTIKVKRSINTLLKEYNIFNDDKNNIELIISRDECKLLRELLKTEIFETEDLVNNENDSSSKKELEEYLKQVRNIYMEVTEKL